MFQACYITSGEADDLWLDHAKAEGVAWFVNQQKRLSMALAASQSAIMVAAVIVLAITPRRGGNAPTRRPGWS